MLYNKNRFKKLNVKKVLHKVKKQWVTVSIALLGLLGVKSVAMHTNVNAANTNNNDNNSANHELGNHTLASANSTLVHSNGAKLTSSGTASQASSSAKGVSAGSSAQSASASSSVPSLKSSGVASSAQNTYGNGSAHQNNGRSNGTMNVHKELARLDNNILDGATRANQAPVNSRTQALGITRMVHRALGEAPAMPQVNADNDTVISQLMNVIHNNVQSGANEAGAKQAYADLLNQFSDLSSVTNSKPVSQWVSMLQNTDNYLHTIRNNGVDNQLLDKTVSKLDSIYSNAQYGAYTSKSYTLNQIATRFDTPGGLVHSMLSGLTSEANLDKIATGMRIINQATTAGTLSNYYNNIISNLKALPNQNKAEQAGTLSQLSSNIKNFTQHIGNVPLSSNSSDQNVEQQLLSSSNPNGIVASLNNTGNAAQNEAALLNNEVAADELNSINSKLNQYNVGSLFNDVINYVTANNDYAKLNDVANDAKADFTDAANASAFINRFVGQIANLKNANATTISNDLNSFKNDSAISNAYNVAKANSNVANDVLDNLADLNSANAVSNLDNVHNVISGDTSLAAINALSNVAASASTEAASVSDVNNYQHLMNNESTLFSAVVNRINASGFSSAAFKTLVNNAETDLSSATNASSFIGSLETQDNDFNGTTANEINTTLNSFANNPEFNEAYQAVRASSADADRILNDLSGMNSANEATKLSDVANVANSHFNNASSFGSLATDATNMATSVSNSQSTAASRAYGALLNDHEASLFSAVVNRIVSRGFSSAAFKTLVNNAKTDLSSAANASDFVTSLEAQDGNFDGVTANDLKTLLNHFASNPEFNKAYQAVRAESASADDMLNDLAEMSAGNEVNELNNIQQIAANHFSNPASFGSLATDASNMAHSVTAKQPARKEVTASSAMNSLVSGFPASAALSYVASKFASSGFDKAALFDTLFSNAKVAFDNHNDTNAGTFMNDFSAQAKADFPANDDEFINAAVSDMASNPNVSGAYSFLRDNSVATNNILDNLATMNSGNASAAFNSVADVINDTPAFKNVPEISTVANSAVSAANSASVSASQSAVASVVESAQNDATAASNAVTDFENNNPSLPSNSDGQLASHEASVVAASDAAQAQNYATAASNDAAAETGVHVAKGQLGAGLPQYVNDVNNARKYRNKVRVDLENAQQDANLSREFANIDKEFDTLGVEPIFKLLLNNAVSHNDYSKLSTAAANALQAFNDNTIQGSTVNSFLKEFTGTGKTFNTLQNHSDNPSIKDAYQIARQNYKATENILNDLSGLNSTNAVRKLGAFYNDLTTNSVAKPDILYKFNQLRTLDKIADDAEQESNVIASNKPNKPKHEDAPHYASQAFNNRLNYGLVKIFADYLANDTNRNDRKLFNNIFGDLKKLPNSNANNGTVNDIINNLGQFQGVLQPVAQKASDLFNMIKDHDASPSDLATYADQLDNKEDGAFINDFNKTMQDVKGQPNNTDYQKVSDELSGLNAKNEDHNLKAIAAAINAHGLKNNPLLKNLALNARHVANAESSERKKNNKQRRSDEAAQKTALQKQHKQDVARHNQIIQDHQQQEQDSIRHNKLVADRHQHNRHDAARADSYAKNASTEAQAAMNSAASAQQYAHGLNSKGNQAYGNSTMASMTVLDVDSYEREATSDATQASDDVNAIDADYDNVSLADADVANASSAASDASNAVNSMNYAITLASKYAKSDGYVAPSSSTSNGSGKSSGSSSSSSSTASGKASGGSGTSSTSSNGTKPSSQSSVTPTSNSKKSSGSTSQSSQPSSGSSSQTSGKSASGSAKRNHSNSAQPASSKASSAKSQSAGSSTTPSSSSATSGNIQPSSEASSGTSNSASGSTNPASNSNASTSASQSAQSASGSTTNHSGSNSATNSTNSSVAPSSVPSSESSGMNSTGSNASGTSAGESTASNSSNVPVLPSQSTNGSSTTPFVPNSSNQSSSAPSFTPASSSQNQVQANLQANVSNPESESASLYDRSHKIKAYKSMINNDVISATKDFNDPIVKRDPKITAKIDKDRQMLRQLQAHIKRDLANPTPRALRDADTCAVRAGLIANDAHQLLLGAEKYQQTNAKHSNGKSGRSANNEAQAGNHGSTYGNGNYAAAQGGTGAAANGESAPSAGVTANSTNGQSKLPQTGEAQNNVAFIIMGLISLSAALISALGVDLDRKRRRE